MSTCHMQKYNVTSLSKLNRPTHHRPSSSSSDLHPPAPLYRPSSSSSDLHPPAPLYRPSPSSSFDLHPPASSPSPPPLPSETRASPPSPAISPTPLSPSRTRPPSPSLPDRTPSTASSSGRTPATSASPRDSVPATRMTHNPIRTQRPAAPVAPDFPPTSPKAPATTRPMQGTAPSPTPAAHSGRSAHVRAYEELPVSFAKVLHQREKEVVFVACPPDYHLSVREQRRVALQQAPKRCNRDRPAILRRARWALGPRESWAMTRTVSGRPVDVWGPS
ncbi:hypothetical protein BC936DRAFT_136653 [Jimgerdemannia flammicorona]|uniref:Uncharacterized protein n=1 Tax=Jimgerdemannia flammicorona TaxID=994334 RepID=A0A433DJG5_9FUNG|nr:hypothetical protein BC936DRAFT_136653 [Jimgerdemannia flammicorona]